MMNVIIFIVLISSFILDFVLFNFLPYAFNSITFIYPMLFLTSNIILFKYLNKYNFYFYIFFIIVYSAVFLNNIILGVILFSFIYFINKKMIKVPIYIRFIISLIIYDLLFYIILIVFLNYDFSFELYGYKIIRSIIFNFIYLYIINLVLKNCEP